jgi:hypothetical protein
MMLYEDQLSRYPTMKGIAVELPFIKFKYVKVDRNNPENARPLRQISTTIPYDKQSTPAVSAPRIIFSRQAEITTLGMDPMVSSASVIHELTYGRIEVSTDYSQAISYPAVKEPTPHSLDVVI